MDKSLVFLGYKSKKTLFVQVVSSVWQSSSIAIHRKQVSGQLIDAGLAPSATKECSAIPFFPGNRTKA